MSNKTISDLRAALFAALDGLTDKTNPMEIERAKAVSEVAQVLINSAKVEVEYMKATGTEVASGFMGEQAQKSLTKAGETVERISGGRVVTHRLVG